MSASFRKRISSWLLGFALAAYGHCHAQELAPRAYVITPTHSNAITLIYSFYDGSVLFDGTVPITDATARVNVSIFNFFHSFSLSGRAANFTATLPYGVGNFRGTVIGAETSAYRSGLLPTTMRLSVNLKGGPAMNPSEFSKWQQKTLLGASLRILPMTGQYDPARLINFGLTAGASNPSLAILGGGDTGFLMHTGELGSLLATRNFSRETACNPRRS